MGSFSKDLETVDEIVEELNEIAGIYKAALERTNDPRIAYIEMLYAHNGAPLSKVGLLMPKAFFCDVFLRFWEDRETQNYEPWRQIAVLGSFLWLWFIRYENLLNLIETIFLKDQKARLLFLIPDLLEQHAISPYVKNPHFGVEIQFDEAKFAYRCLVRSILDESEDETDKVAKIQTLLH